MFVGRAIRRREPAGVWRRAGAWMQIGIPIDRFKENILGFHRVARRSARQVGKAQMDGGNPRQALIVRV
jgi:hypothetical protein